MTQHGQTTAKEHYYDCYQHRNNQSYYNRLILRKIYKDYQNKNYEMKNR